MNSHTERKRVIQNKCKCKVKLCELILVILAEIVSFKISSEDFPAQDKIHLLCMYMCSGNTCNAT